jgi:GNAT superfamily N-acetyltransferase
VIRDRWSQPSDTKRLLLAPRRGYIPGVSIGYRWRGLFNNQEVSDLHAEAFGPSKSGGWDWSALVDRHSLGWVTARSDDGPLVGFVNVIWDGLVHAWLQDVMVADRTKHHGVGTQLVTVARDQAGQAGCEWLHVDFDDHLVSFYFDSCGFTPTNAGLIALSRNQATGPES